MRKLQKLIPAICLAAFTLSGVAVAEEYRGVMARAIMSLKFGLYEQAYNDLVAEAKNGNARAHKKLGSMFYNGEGVERDYQQAFKWYFMAAQLGDGYAQYRLGSMYHKGDKVVERDYIEAALWFFRSAEQGQYGAMQMLGFMHSQGQGVAKDNVAALMWFTIHKMHAKKASDTFVNMIKRKLTADQISQAEHLAKAWVTDHS